MSLDRASNVSNSFIAVRVINKNKAKLYQIHRIGTATKLLRDRKIKAPERYSGVWIAKTYSSTHSPAGYHYINWYDESGKPMGAYISIRDMYPAN
jgi:hypothetical protein